MKNLRLNLQENTESWTLIWHNLIKAALEPDIESVTRPIRTSAALGSTAPTSGQVKNDGSDNASGYEASSEDELEPPQNAFRVVLFKMVFSLPISIMFNFEPPKMKLFLVIRTVDWSLQSQPFITLNWSNSFSLLFRNFDKKKMTKAKNKFLV